MWTDYVLSMVGLTLCMFLNTIVHGHPTGHGLNLLLCGVTVTLSYFSFLPSRHMLESVAGGSQQLPLFLI